MQRQPPRDRAHPRRASAQRARLDRRERDPQGRPDPRAPRRVPRRARSRSTGCVYREGLNAVRDRRRRRRQRHPRRCARSRSTTASPRAGRPRTPSATSAMCSPDSTSRSSTSPPGARPGLDAPARAGVRRRGRRGAAPKYGWTDVARFSALGRPRRQLRTRRPAPRPPRRGAGAARADRGRRARAAGVADARADRDRSARRGGTLPAGAADRHPDLPGRAARSRPAFLFAAAHLSGPGSRFGADAGSATFVARLGCAVVLVHRRQRLSLRAAAHRCGRGRREPWAFMPVYAYLGEGVVGLPCRFVGRRRAPDLARAPGISRAWCCIGSLRDAGIGRRAAMWAVVFFACAPLAALFQVGYAESLFLLLAVPVALAA